MQCYMYLGYALGLLVIRCICVLLVGSSWEVGLFEDIHICMYIELEIFDLGEVS